MFAYNILILLKHHLYLKASCLRPTFTMPYVHALCSHTHYEQENLRTSCGFLGLYLARIIIQAYNAISHDQNYLRTFFKAEKS